jgi:hypothetical protein
MQCLFQFFGRILRVEKLQSGYQSCGELAHLIGDAPIGK